MNSRGDMRVAAGADAIITGTQRAVDAGSDQLIACLFSG